MNRVDLVNITLCCDSASIMNFHSDVISKIVLDYSDSTTNKVRIDLMLVDHVSNINGISSIICHILCETIPLNQDMRLFPLIPVGRIDCDRAAKRPNIFFERIIFDHHHIFIS